MMKTILSYVLWFFMLAMVVIGLDYYRTRSVPSDLPTEIKLKSLNGESVDLAKLSESNSVLVYFWATWCAPCKAVSPTINWLAKSNRVITVAMGSGTDKELKKYLANKNYTFKVINDANSDVGSLLSIQATPTVLIIRDGKIVNATMGVSSPMGLWLRLKLSDFG